VVTDSSGNALEQLGHYPFGESWYNASSDKLLFTSYERDPESGNDYAMMRSSVNRLARFSSPDLLAGSTSDPQSLNHYTYGLNDPSNLVDPIGLDPAGSCPPGTICVTAWGDGGDGGDDDPGYDYNGYGGPGSGPNSSPGVPLIFMGGRGGGKRNFDCTFNIYIGSNSLLDSKGQKAMLDEVNRIFNDAGVGVNPVASPDGADFAVGIGVAPMLPPLVSGPSDAAGNQVPGTNIGIVWLGTLIAQNPGATQAQLGLAAGATASHEIGHMIWPGQGDKPANTSLNAYDVMASPGHVWDGNVTFRPDAARADVLNKCKQMHAAGKK